MKNATVITTIDAFLHCYLSHFLSHFGVPQVIMTDQDAQLESLLFSQFLQFSGCQRNRTTRYHPKIMVW